MNLPDENLRAAIASLSPGERQAFEHAIRTGQASDFAKQVFRKVKARLKREARQRREGKR